MFIVLVESSPKGALMTVEEKMEATPAAPQDDESRRNHPSPAQQAAVVEAAYILEAIRK
jgi:hypothetical protein